MEINRVDLSQFDGSEFDKGAGLLKQTLWFFVNALIVRSKINPFMQIKIVLLRLFGAKIGVGLVIKPEVNIKFPWKLIVGDHVWLGENAWIDNLDDVIIGNHVCISQGAMLLTGNHDYRSASFPYRNAPITLADGVWIGAKSVVCPGVQCGKYSILCAGSIATKNIPEFAVYQGNPAVHIRNRYSNQNI